jgi:aspartyl aminopeptidase
MQSNGVDVARDLMAFIAASPSPFHATVEAARRLSDAGWIGLDERSAWTDVPALGFCVRGGAMVAWAVQPSARAIDGARVVGAHTDSPNLRIKPVADTGAYGWKQLAVEVYGGALMNSWLDRDLGLSGRVALSSGDVRLVRIDRPLARVAQLAIHLDRDVNERGLVLDRQMHLAPLWGLGEPREGELVELVAESIGVGPGEILSYELMLHDLTAPALLGRDEELLAAARLDNLCSCHAALVALQAAGSTPNDAQHGAVVALFDHEEVGSQSATGASGPLLETVLRRLARAGGASDDDWHRMLASSVCVSADMAHAVHPNYPERHEPGHRPVPNAGPAIKTNASVRYGTDAVSAAVFIDACARANVPWQQFVSRSNMACGSTIGPITAAQLGIPTVDVGCPQLSMHSARELMGAADPGYLAAALAAFCLG